MISNYDKFPSVHASEKNEILQGWTTILQHIADAQSKRIVIDCYHGVDLGVLDANLQKLFPDSLILCAESALKTSSSLDSLLVEVLTDDRVFGKMSEIRLIDYFDPELIEDLRDEFQSSDSTIIYGVGAAIIAQEWNLLVYADMARWEIQQRFRKGNLGNIGAFNFGEDFLRKYKRGYFADWRACDEHKKEIFEQIDYLLDTNNSGQPKMVSGDSLRQGLSKCVDRPFRVVPFFDPGPWGGQWMKEVCDLDRSVENFAWCFDCVPEENSLHLQFGNEYIEIPSINLVFFHPERLLGGDVYERFGAEFPIRFDFLDTIDGGNLSLQVHPLKEYIKEQFGMTYTQDESYYMLDADDGAHVYLGLRDGVESEEVVTALAKAQNGGPDFSAEDYVNKFSVKKHDHVLIPAGTIHCSGKGSMVLEISATPYIFTFKLWDWGRLGLDGKPRPIHLDHGKNVIQWERQTEFAKRELVNVIEPVAEGNGWREERTGLHELEFIETRRHWFTDSVEHDTQGTLNVLNLVEGRVAIVESPTNSFAPFEVHYAETFIIPANVGKYTIRPIGESEGQECATIKAFVRKQPNQNGQFKN